MLVIGGEMGYNGMAVMRGYPAYAKVVDSPEHPGVMLVSSFRVLLVYFTFPVVTAFYYKPIWKIFQGVFGK